MYDRKTWIVVIVCSVLLAVNLYFNQQNAKAKAEQQRQEQLLNPPAPMEGGAAPEKPGVMELLMKNGVTFTEGDRVVFYEKSSTLEVVASQLAVELINGIVRSESYSPLRMIRASFVLVESKNQLTREDLKAGRYRIRQKVVQHTEEGLFRKMILGREKVV